MRYRPSWFYRQSAVVPYRFCGESIEVLLITSRGGKRWTIPKGVVERTMTPAASAAKEAYEEAGVRGDADTAPLGSFEYEKWGGTCVVEVYALHVREVLDVWPESRQRRRRWLTVAEAKAAVATGDHRRLPSSLVERLQP